MTYKNKDEQRAYQREWIARRRSAWLAAHGPCVNCGSRSDLQVDHIDRSTKVDHKVWSWGRARMDAELAKCQVLCIDCHKKKTREEWDSLTPHGTYSKRNTYGCKCDECMQYVRRIKQEWRMKKKNGMVPDG